MHRQYCEMPSNRALLKAFISLVLIAVILQPAESRANSTNANPSNSRYSGKRDVEDHRPQHGTATAYRPSLSYHKKPHSRSNGHRHPQRRNPQSQTRSASSTRYSVLQPNPLPHVDDFGYYRNGRRQDTRESYFFRQKYASNTTPRNEEQQPFIYINLQTGQNPNLPESGQGQVYGQPQNRQAQALQRPVEMRDAPGSEARPNRIAEYQRQTQDVQSRVRSNTEKKQEDEREQQQSIIVPLDVASQEGQEKYRYFKITISPDDLKSIEKYSQDPQKLSQTKSEEANVSGNQARTLQQPKINSNSIPASQTQQGMPSPLTYSVMGIQNQKATLVQEPQKMMMQQPNVMTMMTIQEPQKMMMQQPTEMAGIQQPMKLVMQQQNDLLLIPKTQKIIMQQPNEVMMIQEPQKIMMLQPNEMQKQATDILREMNSLREKTTKVVRQEGLSMENQKAMDRRRQIIADKISETVYQQMMDLLGHLTGETATQIEVEAKQQNPSAVIYQPLVVMQRQEKRQTEKQPAARSQTEEEMDMQKQKLMAMLLQQMSEIQKQITEQKTQDAMQPQRSQGIQIKPQSTTDMQAPVKMEELKQDLMQMLAQMLMEMQQYQAKGREEEPGMNLQKQMSPKQEEKSEATESQEPSADMEMKMIQVMEVLLNNIIEMRKQQLNEQQERMGVKVQSQNMMAVPVGTAAEMNAQDTMKSQPQPTISSQRPMQVEMSLRKATEEQVYRPRQRPETMEIPIRQTMEENQQMQNQHFLKTQDSGMGSSNIIAQTVSDKANVMNRAKETFENTKNDQEGNAPESNGEMLGYRQVLIHIPHGLTKNPKVFSPQNNQRSTAHPTGFSSDTNKNSNDNQGSSLSYPSIRNPEASVQEDLGSSDGALDPNVRIIPVIKSPIQPKSYDNYDFRQSEISSPNPAIYEIPSLHDANPFFQEPPSNPRTVFKSNLYSYDGASSYGGDPSLIQRPIQLYSD